jgi:hypothetical protein
MTQTTAITSTAHGAMVTTQSTRRLHRTTLSKSPREDKNHDT